MKTALAQLLDDFASALVFALVYWWSGSLLLATCVAVAVALGQVGLVVLGKKRGSAMRWMGLGLAVGLGSLSLITSDSRFVQLKPTIGHFAIGAVMLKRGWQEPYMPALVRQWVPQRTLVLWGYGWAAAMFLMGSSNVAAALWLSVPEWALFVSALLLAKLALFLLQYLQLRITVSRALARSTG
ncbi:MAG TPA: septation protein IspZ [Polyangiales bacterium]|nr:septation protein IspZ [Polyangiales bacterium]